MHPSSAFKVEGEAALLAHLSTHPFAAIVAAPGGTLRIAHAPVLARAGVVAALGDHPIAGLMRP